MKRDDLPTELAILMFRLTHSAEPMFAYVSAYGCLDDARALAEGGAESVTVADGFNFHVAPASCSWRWSLYDAAHAFLVSRRSSTETAFTVVEDRQRFAIAACVQTVAGQHVLDDYARYDEHDRAQAVADSLNRRRGLSAREVATIVSSTMTKLTRRRVHATGTR